MEKADVVKCKCCINIDKRYLGILHNFLNSVSVVFIQLFNSMKLFVNDTVRKRKMNLARSLDVTSDYPRQFY